MTVQTITSNYSTNTYVICDEGLAVVIDPSGDADKIDQYISKNGCKLVAILLTHGHFDHIDALQKLATQSGASTYISRNDAAMLSDPYLNASWLVFENLSVTIDNVHLLDGVEELCFGKMTFKALATPGHTLGSICYLLERALFSGDTLFADGYGRTDLPNSAPKQYASSLLSINKLLKSCTLYPGHGRIIYKE